MYNPALPNYYRDVVFSTYVRRRQQEEEALAQKERTPNALASALSASSLRGTSTTVAPSSLGLSAEELHLHRLKESAALGIQRAVEMEKDALEVEHKKRKLEGSDARSRISSRLDKLKALAAKSKTMTSASSSAGEVAAPNGDASTTSSPAPTVASSSMKAPQTGGDWDGPTSAPLIFHRSSLAAGGYVMTSSTSSLPGSAQASATRSSIQGKPSSTLLLRYWGHGPLDAWTPEMITEASTSPAARASLSEPVLAQVQQQCRRFGFVRSMAARVYTENDIRTMLLGAVDGDPLPPMPAPPVSPTTAEIRREQLRLWVRYDSVTEAFKAAETLARGGPSTALFAVSFYPTSLYDEDQFELRAEDALPRIPASS